MNQQPVEKSDWRPDGSLDIHSVWWTLQGEGPLNGSPAVFVRVAGCNLMCPICDTDYTSRRQRMSPEELLAAIQPLHPSYARPLVVFTGGEPLRQNLAPALELLRPLYRVQIETNGSLCPPQLPLADIVVSPKSPIIQKWVDANAIAYKYVLEAGHVDPKDGLPTRALGGAFPARPSSLFKGEIFVQPCDEKDPGKNLRNQQAALDSCMKHGYRLSLQMHKLLGLE